MRTDRLISLAVEVAGSSAIAAAYRAALPTGRCPRRITLAATITCILLAPLLVPREAKALRLAGTMLAITFAVKLYDLGAAADAGIGGAVPRSGEFIVNLFNPFVLVFGRVAAEPARTTRRNLVMAATGWVAGVAAIVLIDRVFRIGWHSRPFVFEHAAKAASLFAMIQFLPNGIAALMRLAGMPATDFAGPFFLARTPAEFWRLYNRPVNQFFDEYVFRRFGGRREMVKATLVTFAVSGLIHEYVFDVPASRVLGTQMAFFLIQGLGVVATLRVRPRGWYAVPAALITFGFNLATVRLFLGGLNAIIPFYAGRD